MVGIALFYTIIADVTPQAERYVRLFIRCPRNPALSFSNPIHHGMFMALGPVNQCGPFVT